MDILKVNEFIFLNEEVEEFKITNTGRYLEILGRWRFTGIGKNVSGSL